MVLTQEFLIHAGRNPPLREAFSHRIAWGRDVIAHPRRRNQENGARLPLPAEDLATGREGRGDLHAHMSSGTAVVNFVEGQHCL